MKADIQAADHGEMVSKMGPLSLSEDSRHRGPLLDLAVELAQRSSGFQRSLPANMLEGLASLVRSMNCYYSNLIEGHYTHPVDIERAMKGDFSRDVKKRDLQQEAKAHIAVQAWIDGGGLPGTQATSAVGILEIHRRFCAELPEEMLWVEVPDSQERIRMVPGAIRDRFVHVGQHVAISAGAVPRFLERFEEHYGGLGRSATILASAAAHHRLLWMHPFLYGNGRVARLMSHAMLLRILETGGVWSIARGLARSVQDYKGHLARCDQQRRNDLDGRGNLSEEALAAFTRYFLETCLDQVSFMESLLQPDRLRARVLLWAEEEIRLGALPAPAIQVLQALLYRGELLRGEVDTVIGGSDRHARRVVSALVERGVLTSSGVRASLRLAFPAVLASRWLPGLFPESPS